MDVTAFEKLLAEIPRACRSVYGDRLTSIVVFGSVGRGTPRPDSDIDLLIVADDLPSGRIRRVREFEEVRCLLATALATARATGLSTRLAPIFKTPVEAQRGSPLFFDMTEDARLLYDRDGFFQGCLDDLRTRLAGLGARRVWKGDAWYWDLKPDYRPGEVFDI
jgi:predicted nucleotidyltransferase